MSDRLDTLRQDIRQFVDERDWEQFHDPKNLAMAIASEAGELLAELRWIDGGASDGFCRDPEQRPKVVDEIADIAICLLMLCDRIDLDLPKATHDKLRRIREKYPVEEWRGR
ncbi:MAG: nucleotide pyrophosphohydrolase [Myxococcota bacterium]